MLRLLLIILAAAGALHLAVSRGDEDTMSLVAQKTVSRAVVARLAEQRIENQKTSPPVAPVVVDVLPPQEKAAQGPSRQEASTAPEGAGRPDVPCSPANGNQPFCVYTVRAGDSLSGIAAALGVRATGGVSATETLALSNGLLGPEGLTIQPNQQLRIPLGDGVIHTVRAADVLSRVAQEYGVSMTQIIQENHLSDPDTLVAGQAILIPSPTSLPVASRCQDLAGNSPFCVYVVQPGDTLSEIAARFGLKGNAQVSAVEMLAQSNKPGVKVSDSIVPGQSLRIPRQSGIVHTVLTSETLSEIASSYGVTTATLASANGISDGSRILIGEDLLIPNPQRLPPGQPVAATSTETPEPGNPSDTDSPTPTPSPTRTPAVEAHEAVETEEPTATPRSRRTPEPTTTRETEPEPTATAERSPEPTPRPRRTATPTPEPEEPKEQAEETPEAPQPTPTPERKPEATAAPQQVSSSRYIWPTRGPISSYFGPSHPLGIDIDLFSNPNADIVAARSGKVIYVGGNTCCSYGLYVIVDHGDGVETLYAHLSRLLVSQGQTVNQGDLLGYGGRTGYATGNHLHFEVRVNGTPVNPLNYLP